MSNIIIVGANQGIGYYLAESLLESANKVAVLDVKTENISKLQPRFEKSLLIITADAADDGSIQESVKKAHATFGSIDIAVHNACLCTFESEPDTEPDVYRKVMNINYFGALRLAKAVLPYMREAKSGRLIFTSSAVGVSGFKNISPYASSKGAIESLAKCLEIENSAYGISVHLFHPPLTNTTSASGLMIPAEFKASPQKVGRGLAKRIYSKKFVICSSASTALSLFFCYRHPLFFGKMLTKMTERAERERMGKP